MSRERRTPNRQPSSTNFFLFFAIVLLIVLLFRVIFTDTDIPVSSTDAEATGVANERLFQLAQWAIGSILTIGIALIGFNWAQTQRDRAEIDDAVARIDGLATELRDRQSTFQSDVEARIKQLEYAVLFSWDANMGERLLQEARQETYPLDPTPGYFIRKFRIRGSPFALKRANALLVLQRADVEASKNTITDVDIQELNAFLPELLEFDQALGNVLAQFLRQREKPG